MDETSPSWFYSRNGETVGPIGFDELKVRADAGELSPRLDHVWTEGMSEWKPAGDIDGLFHRRPQPNLPPPSYQPPQQMVDPYRSPRQEALVASRGLRTDWPGTGRTGYILAILVFPFVWSALIMVGAAFSGKEWDPNLLNAVASGVPFIVAVVVGLRRLVNLSMSRWWYLAHFVPILNLWIGYRSFACPAGYAEHKKLDGAGIFLAVVYWLLVVLCIGAAVLAVAILLGHLGTPELQEQLREAIREAQAEAAAP